MAVSDIATLSIKIDATDATRSVKALTAAQQELVAKAEKVAASSQNIDIQNKKAVASYLQEVAQVRAVAQQMGILDEVQKRTSQSAQEAASHSAAYAQQMKALKTEVGAVEAASTGAVGGFGRIRQGLVSLVAQATGTIPVLDRIGAQFLSMEAGGNLALGVVAGLGAIALAWRALTRDTREAEKAQDEALKRQEEFSRKKHLDSGGEFGSDVSGANASLNRALREKGTVIGLEARGGAVGGLATLYDLFVGQTNASLARAVTAVRDGRQVLGEEVTKNFLDIRGKDAQTLAENIKSNNLAHGERQRALAMLKQDVALMAQYRKSGVSGDLRSQLGSEIETLDSALHPDAKPARKSDAEREAERLRKEEEAVRSMVRGLDDEYAASQRMLAATNESADAGAKQARVEEIRQAMVATGLALSDQRYAQVEREITQTLANNDAVKALNKTRKEEQDSYLELAKRGQQAIDEIEKKDAEEAMREQERKVRDFKRVASSVLYGLFTDLTTKGKNAFQSIWDAAKAGFFRMVSDILAAKIAAKFAGAFGLLAPETTQAKAAREMKEAADKQYRAAVIMNGGADPGPAKPGTTPPATMAAWTKAMGAGAAGYGSGYAIGQATGSKVYGAIGGAISGAALGNAILPGGAGAIIGGLTGLAGGILGAGSAAREAKRQMEELQKAFQNTFDALKAELDKDTLGQAVAQIHAQYEAARKALDDATTVKARVIAGSPDNKAYLEELRKINEMEKKRIAQLQEEAAILQKRQVEDYKVRELRAQGKTKEADALAFKEQQQREREDLVRSFGDSIDATEAATLAAYDAAAAAEKNAFELQKNTTALNLNTAVRNAPTGFKVEPYIQQFAQAMARPVPTSKLTPSPGPMYSLPNATFVLQGVTDGPSLLKKLATALDQSKGNGLGPNATRAAALERV